MAPMTTNQFDVFASFASQEAFCAFHSNYSSNGVVRLMYSSQQKNQEKKKKREAQHTQRTINVHTNQVGGRPCVANERKQNMYTHSNYSHDSNAEQEN